MLNHRVVNIIGFPGIGKTAVAKNAINYIADRRLFKLGIIYYSCKGYQNCGIFIKKFTFKVLNLAHIQLN